MISIKLAFKNLFGAGLRTWLNSGVLSFSFVVIIFFYGIIDGWNVQASRDTKEWEIGKGQLWQPKYDPLDIFTFQDAHSQLSATVQSMVNDQQLTPILLVQASAYPQGNMVSLLLKGIDPNQKILKLPSGKLRAEGNEIPAIIGKRMANSLKIKEGESMLVRWRDKNGTFDAREVKIVSIFKCNVPTVDNGQIWIPLDKLQQMLDLPNEATFMVAGDKYNGSNLENWVFRDRNYLLKDINFVIKSKKGSTSVLCGLMLLIALLAIFDTQVLSIFRRQREIGTYIALGMTRWQVVRIFTVEGTAYSIFAAVLAAIYGTPLMIYFNNHGYSMPKSTTDMNISISDVIYPKFSIGLIISTIIIVILSATIVSFLPARKIAKLKPTDALKGKIQ